MTRVMKGCFPDSCSVITPKKNSINSSNKQVIIQMNSKLAFTLKIHHKVHVDLWYSLNEGRSCQ